MRKAATVSGPQAVSVHHAAVVFDPADGRIVHTHHFIVLEGGSEPAREDRESMAREAADLGRSGRSTVEVIHVDGEALLAGRRYRVDASTRDLVDDGPARG